MNIKIKPQWGKSFAVAKTHFYLPNGRSVCDLTTATIRKGEAIFEEFPTKPDFCKYCMKKIAKKFEEESLNGKK